ncbi:hypothetical protein JTE90_003845 [Oedothorax gibbosus]|uniref:Uncharacterized protein n=1 Tax=Oedothorax gibbosus TaxID=931172 RepID=A0AAV6TFP6_9ARAC|nr:hypothetical protein JTE90_003845 [Oedothorax gibbosus]
MFKLTVTWNPSQLQPQGSHLSIATTTKICTAAVQAGSRPAPSNARQPRPSYSLRPRKPPRGSLPRSARYRPNAGASSIFRASCFGRCAWLHTLSEFRLPWPSFSDCLEQPTPFMEVS